MGTLMPCMCLEVVPSDKVMIEHESILKFMPLVSPPMHRMDAFIHTFFVPNRILWENWNNFWTNTKDPITGLLPAVPTLTQGTGSWSKLSDYLGIPIPIGDEEEIVSALPFAAYQKVFNEYYRDENLQTTGYWDDTLTPLVDGSNDAQITELNALRLRAWEHDYFTSALPFAQKGDPVTLPLAGFNDTPIKHNLTGTTGTTESEWDATTIPGGTPTQVTASQVESENTALDEFDLYADNADLSVSTTINDLRRAYKIQEWLERLARAGSRPVETLLSIFGVQNQDARLQRPEYICGIKTPVSVSEVLNTSDTASAPQGNMSGRATAFINGKRGYYNVKEHGFIISIMSILPRTSYQQGLERFWMKTDPTEYANPILAHLGERAIKNKEIYAFQGAPGEDTFGYTPQYAEYKYMSSRVAGQMRTTLSSWTFSRIFGTAPALNGLFISAVPRMDPFAVTDPNEDHLVIHVYNKVKALRPLPQFGTPTT